MIGQTSKSISLQSQERLVCQRYLKLRIGLLIYGIFNLRHCILIAVFKHNICFSIQSQAIMVRSTGHDGQPLRYSSKGIQALINLGYPAQLSG